MHKVDFETLSGGFYKLSLAERLERVARFSELSKEEVDIISGKSSLKKEQADHLIENTIGIFPMPLGVANYFNIDGVDRFIPMCVEETSIIAAASANAKWVRNRGCINTWTEGRLIIGQVQLPNVSDTELTLRKLTENRNDMIDLANQRLSGLVRRGGGIKDIEFRTLERSDKQGSMVVLHLLCDPCDAMGANLINQACEALKPPVEEQTGEKVGLCILSNLVDSRLACARVTLSDVDEEQGTGIEEASIFAESDPHRACTHNKGILNGIDPILIATGNDWRATEAGIHAYAARTGSYQPVATWRYSPLKRQLIGILRVPMAVGTVGGVTKVHPSAKVALKILKVSSAEELGRICGAVGLVQNMGALKALATVGIVKGHMSLHAKNLAIAAGANEMEIPRLVSELGQLISMKKTISVSVAKELLVKIRPTAVDHVSATHPR